jgi:hypothetical protein
MTVAMQMTAWTIEFDSLADNNELASKVRRLLDQAQAIFRKHGMELLNYSPSSVIVYYFG